MSSEILDCRSQVSYSILQFTDDVLENRKLYFSIFWFQVPFGIRSEELQEGFKNDFDFAEDADDVDIEYCVYDVTPDVSIDFVSFTTEESEGNELHLKTF